MLRNMATRRQRFQAAIDDARKRALIEELDLGGFLPTKLDEAIDQDWLHLLMTGVTNAAEAVRFTHPDDDRERRRLLRKALSLVVATAEEWEKRL